MKHLLILLVVAGCTKPAVEPTAPVVDKPHDESPVVDRPAPVETSLDSAKAELFAIALASPCATEVQGNRGVPPKGFMRGIALSFARAVCNPDTESYQATVAPLGLPAKDALAHYGLTLPTPKERLEHVYALMVGSAGRESSWRWCVGRDASASNYSADTCEAGMYQTSFNARNSSKALPALFAKYKADKSGCFAAEYKGSTTCNEFNMKNWGSGEGVEFQRLSKECPGFATEFHAIVLRNLKSHYGPILRKEAPLKLACITMFQRIRAAIEAKPSICRVI